MGIKPSNQSIRSTQPSPIKAGHVTPHLEYKAEFEAILSDYQLSPGSEAILKTTPMVILCGPTGTGRNTAIRDLVKSGHYYYLISDTTRPPRQNDGVIEKPGEEYFFRTEQHVLSELKAGHYVEAELIHQQQVSGTHIGEVKKAHAMGKIALNEIEIKGALHTLKLKPDTTAIMLLPPSFDEWLRRVRQRTAMDPAELLRRLQTATEIFKTGLSDDRFVFVVNDELNRAVETIDQIARFGVHYTGDEAESRQLAQRLYDQTVTYLAQHTTAQSR